MTQARGALEVILFADRRFVGSLMFTSRQITIGSAPGCQVRLEDPSVSPEHALLHFTGRTCVIEDSGGTGGVWCAGERVDNHLVQPTDEIQIGRYSLRFVIHREEAAQPAHPVAAPIVAAPLVAAPVAVAPFEVAPVEAAPFEVAPFEVAPFEVAPVEAAPFEIAPVPSAPVEAAPVEIAPVRAAMVEVARDVEAAGPEPLPSAAVDLASVVFAPDLEPLLADVASPLQHALAEEREHVAQDGDHDDHDEDDDFVPGFSLVEALRQHVGEEGPAPTAAQAVVQAITSRDDLVVDISHVSVGGKLEVPGDRGCLCLLASPGRLKVRLAAGVAYEVRRRGESAVLDQSRGSRAGVTLELDPTLIAHLQLGAHEQLLLHFVRDSGQLPSTSISLGPRRENVLTIISALIVHVLIFIALGAAANERSTQARDINEGRFAMLDMKDPVLEAPPPKVEKKKPEKIKKPPPPKPSTEPKLPPTAPAPLTPPPSLPAALRNLVQPKNAAPQQYNPKASAKANQLMNALGSLGAPSASAQAMTNLNAVTGLPSASGGYKISGTIGKMGGDGLHLAAGGSGVGRVDTHSGSEFGKLGVVAAGPKGGKVRGQVTKAPASMIEVQGELDRGEVQKVVNSHISQVVGCYERRLIKDASLAGKVTMEWIIDTTGGVGVVRVKFSEIRDTEVSTCMQSAIRGWHFPSPKGGNVTITYPFVFGQLGL